MLRKVFRGYEQIYAALYGPTLKRWTNDDYMASFMTAMGLAGAIAMNVALVIGAFANRFGPMPQLSRWLFFIIPGAIIVLNWYVFLREDRSAEVVRQFAKRSAADRHRIAVFAWTYVIASYVTPLVFALVMAGKMKQ